MTWFGPRRFFVKGTGASLLYTISRPHGILAAPASSIATPADVQTELLRLEREAEKAGVLQEHRATSLHLNERNVYAASLPRLVELVDSALNKRPVLAERSAVLLSLIYARERVVPAMLGSSVGLRGTIPPFESVQAEYQQLFETVTVRPEHTGEVKWYADRLLKNRNRYEARGKDLGVPWYIIGLTHALEASFNFLAHLHNGDVPLSQVTRHVPTGRPQPWEPPYTWERSAADALQIEHLTGLKDWSLPRTLYRLEGFNGFGYRSKKINTPYLWSYSNHYKSGKYVQDGKWSPTAVSQQCGAAVMLHELVRRGELSF